jgi:menaquinone-dependent protoporphyrinogen oxidase
MRVLVVYASRAGSTRGIAEFVGEKLRANGIQADLREADSSVDPGGYDAFVIGSAVYQYHWLKEAREFVSKNSAVLGSRPVWVFSSGPTGPKDVDKKGRDLREATAPKERDEIRRLINPRDHHIFFGAFFPDRVKGAMGFFARMTPKEEQGDFRNWAEIEAWANGIAKELSPQAGPPGSKAEPPK